MKVTLIAATEATVGGADPGITHSMEEWLDTDPLSTYADDLAEFAGRACYQSWSKPNPKTAANADYLAHILEVGHYSVLAHASATFYIEGVSRALTHELIRSRFLAFSQLSQRYVSEDQFTPVLPPAIAALDDDHPARTRFASAMREAQAAYGRLVNALDGEGLTRKQVREAARSVLPNAVETRIVVSGNLRAWRDFLTQRLSPTADAEIRALAEELLRQLRPLAPGTFSDFAEAVT